MKRGKRCYKEDCLAAAPFASRTEPEVHACEIHKKRDFVNMRNKRCLAPGCLRNPHYGVSRLIDPNSKAQYCTTHKSPGMQNVNGGRCAGQDCSKQPRFSMPGEKGKFCSKHREPGMVDVLYTPCHAEGCKKHPHFGKIEGGPRYCAQHRSEGMVDVKHRRCAVKSCRKDRALIPGSANKRGKFCEVHCDVSELGDKDDASSKAASTNDKKRSRAWIPDMEDDRGYMSSEGSQLGSSMGDMTSNTPYDYHSTMSSARASIASIHDAAQGLAHLAMMGARERAPAYAGSGAGMPRSRGRDHEDDYGHAPFQHSGHPETFRRGMARAAAARGPSHPDYDHHAMSGSTRLPFYPGNMSNPDTDPYPLFKRDAVHPDAPFEDERPRMSPPDLRRNCSNSSGNGTSPPASTSNRSLRLRYSPEYSTYPYPWEFNREEQGARWAEPSSVRRPMPVRGWNGHPSDT